MDHPIVLSQPVTSVTVKEFRQILLWPLQLMPLHENAQVQNHWEALMGGHEQCPWHELSKEFTGKAADFTERHYREFAAFLPYVQRLIYGDRSAGAKKGGYARSPIRTYRRTDILNVRAKMHGAAEAFLLDIIHADLYFFHDVDVVIMSLEVAANNISLGDAQNIMYHLGRVFPSGWNAAGIADHCFEKVEWLGADNQVLAVSDYEMRDKFIESVCNQQVEHIAAHWDYLLRPMVTSHSPSAAPLRYRQLEYYRMPLMAYLAVDNPAALTRDDYMRMTFVSAPGQATYTAREKEFLDDFENHYCYDRFYHPGKESHAASTRIMCSGYAFVAVGDANRAIFTDPERGFHAQFRHQLKLLGMLSHFHKAALLMISDRVVTAMSRLEIDQEDTVKRFRREMRSTLEIFLRFSHRYWFSDVSEQAMPRDLFKMWAEHLDTHRLFRELREEIHDMNQYLESEMLSRQAVTILQLTVVTMLSLIGTVTTGFLGMNIFLFNEGTTGERTIVFWLVFAATTLLTLATIFKSRRLAVLLDAISSEDATWGMRWRALLDVFRKK